MKFAALALAISMGAFAGACGPSAPEPTVPTGGTEAPPSGGSETPPAGQGFAPGEPAPGTEPKQPEKGPEAAGTGAKSTPLSATQMEAEFKKIGINTAKIPELEKLPLAQKKKVMPLLQKALGYETCNGCHVEGDFKKDTRNMKVAREMWRRFVVPLKSESGGMVGCDSCHNGKEHVLARQDRKAVEKFMEDEYEHKLTLANKEEMACSTCHGDAMELKIVEKLWGIAKK